MKRTDGQITLKHRFLYDPGSQATSIMVSNLEYIFFFLALNNLQTLYKPWDMNESIGK